ncbi:uncharacterized protein G2W53_029639 [Senna tora]|uniref:Uncharacterized protein n=1 Tax=Senna tora TaxID=362788 RepID=A0A834T5Z2_9FABA|nr:uncharacterized protein G2W53_029639 [Senna tora]
MEYLNHKRNKEEHLASKNLESKKIASHRRPPSLTTVRTTYKFHFHPRTQLKLCRVLANKTFFTCL